MIGEDGMSQPDSSSQKPLSQQSSWAPAWHPDLAPRPEQGVNPQAQKQQEQAQQQRQQ
jgi:hypothetical protein